MFYLRIKITSFNKKSILFACLCILHLTGNAQFNGYPIRNYTPKEYNAFTQNWDCVQDKRGMLYFGNSSNVLEYDGISWRKIPVAQGVAVRSLCMDSAGTIYVGSVGEFGFLTPEVNGDLVYRSLSKDLSENLKEFADVWKIHRYKKAIIFQTSENLFLYENSKITVITPTNSFSTLSFISSGNFYVRERLKGLMKLNNGKLELVKGGEQFHDIAILGIIPFGGKAKSKKLILTGDAGFYLMDEANNGMVHFPTKVEAYLNSAGVLGLQWLNDSTIYINSRIGLIFLNKKLEFQKIINKTDGLNDETIAAMFVDKQNELWLSTNNGITRVSINSPLYYYNNNSGFSGNIQAIINFREKIVVGTTVGMFHADIKKQNRSGLPDKLNFSPIQGTFFEAWNFQEHNKNLLAATSDGVFHIDGNNAVRVTRPYANDINGSLKNKEVIYVAEKGGLRILKNIQGSKYEEQHFFELTADDIMTVHEFDDGSSPDNETLLWLTTRNRGILKMTFDEKYDHKISRYDTFNDVIKEQVEIIIQEGQLYFCSAKGSFIYDKNKDDGKEQCFFPAKPKYYSYDKNGVHTVYWDSLTTFGKKARLGMLAMEELPYTFYQNNNEILWIGLTNELVRFDGGVSKIYDTKFNVLIRKAIIGKDSVLFGGTSFRREGDKRITSLTQGEEQILALSYKTNSITFEYASLFFEREEKTKYSYKLVGFDTAWSSWSVNTVKQYTNLFEGEYTFMVKAKNIYGFEGETAQYTFSILPPWYRAIGAYFLYGIAFILLIYVVVKISMRRLIAAKEKLEKIVTERTAEVVQQKEELLQKNTLIEIAYTDITSSINYAKRIQESILPLKDQIKRSFSESFVLFKPRDVVSGDFYWFAMHNNKKIIACVDCTGHGVPGAFMSMIGNTLLNQIVNEKGIVKPSEILNQLHERVRQSLKQDLENSETRDGMDIAVCTIDEKNSILEYAGANRPLYMIRNNVLEEMKPDKQAIGGDQLQEDKRFTNHVIGLKPDDSIYMCTDGYADQFGGEKGKKFMIKRFHQTLLEIQSSPMELQGETLKGIIEQWQGNIEQVDDILVMGIRI